LIPVLKTKGAILSEFKEQKDELNNVIKEIKVEGQKTINEIKEVKEKLNKVLLDE
jgi:hypothetical protein